MDAVEWVLQHPCFLMTWVLAPTLFGKKIDTLSQQYFEIKAWQHFVLSISTHGFKFLTWALCMYVLTYTSYVSSGEIGQN